MRRRLLTLVALLLAVAALPATALARSRGDVQVLALLPSPGYPALPHVMAGNIYEGTYDNPSGSGEDSLVFEFSPSGQHLHTWVVGGQDTSQPHGVQVAANDSRGNLLLLDKTSGRIIRLDPRTGRETLYAQVPDLPSCSSAPAGAQCSPTTMDQAPMPDYAAWGPDGSLYVTDYQQAVIWRVPPGGGTPAIWLASRQLDGGPFGTACIVMMPDHHTLLFDQASQGGLGGANPTTGKLYEVGIQADGKPGALRQLWESGPADAPDGCALTTSGHIFLALVGGSNQIIELTSSGQEITRFGQQYTGNNNSPVPFDSPSGLAFFGTRLIIANQSYFADNPANQALLDLETGEQGAPVYVPRYAGYKPPRRSAHRRRHHRRGAERASRRRRRR